jgi:hypothetical protein
MAPTRAHQGAYAKAHTFALGQLFKDAILGAQPLVTSDDHPGVREPGTRSQGSFDGSLGELEHDPSVT